MQSFADGSQWYVIVFLFVGGSLHQETIWMYLNFLFFLLNILFVLGHISTFLGIIRFHSFFSRERMPWCSHKTWITSDSPPLFCHPRILPTIFSLYPWQPGLIAYNQTSLLSTFVLAWTWQNTYNRVKRAKTHLRQRLKWNHFTVWRADVEINIGSLVSLFSLQ